MTKFSLHLSFAGEPYSEKLKVTSLELQRTPRGVKVLDNPSLVVIGEPKAKIQTEKMKEGQKKLSMFLRLKVLSLILPGTVTLTGTGLACVTCLQHVFAVWVPVDCVKNW